MPKPSSMLPQMAAQQYTQLRSETARPRDDARTQAKMVELGKMLVLGSGLAEAGLVLHYTQAHEGADGNLFLDREGEVPYDNNGEEGADDICKDRDGCGEGQYGDTSCEFSKYLQVCK